MEESKIALNNRDMYTIEVIIERFEFMRNQRKLYSTRQLEIESRPDVELVFIKKTNEIADWINEKQKLDEKERAQNDNELNELLETLQDVKKQFEETKTYWNDLKDNESSSVSCKDVQRRVDRLYNSFSRLKSKIIRDKPKFTDAQMKELMEQAKKKMEDMKNTDEVVGDTEQVKVVGDTEKVNTEDSHHTDL